MQYACRAKLGKMRREPSQIGVKTGFLNKKVEMLSDNNSAVGLLAPSQGYSTIKEEEACQL
jgi:hypothetical protein